MSTETRIPPHPESLPASVSGFSGYRWLMVVVAAVAMVATLPGRTHGLGMITERLLSDPDFQLTRASYGMINLWATLLGALFCLGVGQCIDRYGIRLTLTVVMGLLGAVVVGMSTVTSVWLLFLAIMLTRGFGQSALSVVSITIVGKWFDKQVSLPMAIYSVLMSVGFIAAALLGRECADLNWRVFWSGTGWIILGATVVLALITRDRQAPPADSAESRSPENQPEQQSSTLRQAMRTPAFWVFASGISLYGMIVSGISLFNESILADQGFSKEVYYNSLALGTGVGMLSNLLAGALGLKWSFNRLLALSLFMLSGSMIWLTQLKTSGDVAGYVIVSASAGGILTVMFFSVWPALYGRKHLGRNQGLAQMMTVLASALGPLVFAQCKTLTGSYRPLLYLLAACLFCAAVIGWLTPLPQIKYSSTGVS